jgi:magnesium transporter
MRRGRHFFLSYREKSSFSQSRYQSRYSRTYDAIRFDNAGHREAIKISVPDLLKEYSLHGRDILPLELASLENRSGAPSILPRSQAIVLAVSHFRAVIDHEHVLLFHPEGLGVQLSQDSMAQFLQEAALEQKNVDEEDQIPFELLVVEAMLGDMCGKYNQRVQIFRPVVDGILKDLLNYEDIANGNLSAADLQKLLPLKDGLANFEQRTSAVLKMIKELLNNDEDMVGLLMGEKQKRGGGKVPLHLHDQVELLLEDIYRQMSSVLQEVIYLKRRVDSTQELLAIQLDNYRNNIIRINVHLTMASVGMALSTTVAGLFGMNMLSGLEEHPYAFWWTTMATTTAGIFVYAGVHHMLHSSTGTGSHKRMLPALQTTFTNMDTIQQVMVSCMQDGRGFTRQRFRDELSRTRGGMPVSKEEIDIVFDVFDQSHNGEINASEFESGLSQSVLHLYQAPGHLGSNQQAMTQQTQKPQSGVSGAWPGAKAGMGGPVGALLGRIPAEGSTSTKE